MGILIGMDEAGYGPNLGPLVVAATAWEGAGGSGQGSEARGQGGEVRGRRSGVEQRDGLASTATPNLVSIPSATLAEERPAPCDLDLYARLRKVVAPRASQRRIAIADSKVLYRPGQGLRQLERGVLAVLAALHQPAHSWSQLVTHCVADRAGRHRSLPWHADFDGVLPIDVAADEVSPLSERLSRNCAAVGARPLLIRARLVYPSEFNELVEYFGSKGAALSHVTMGLLREVVAEVSADWPQPSPSSPQSLAPSPQPPAPRPQTPTPSVPSHIFAVCDKHGARNRYAALLQHHFAEHWIEPVLESHAESRYAWGPPESRVQVAFRMQGERFLPTALASMTAKYLRELAMRAFNKFWCARVPGLRPTAGYPVDARRFKDDIAAAQRELGIDDHVLWRNR